MTTQLHYIDSCVVWCGVCVCVCVCVVCVCVVCLGVLFRCVYLYCSRYCSNGMLM